MPDAETNRTREQVGRRGLPQLRAYRPGLGDLLVGLAFVLLAWAALSPHFNGRSSARLESEARRTLLRLMGAGERSGLFAALDAIHAAARRIEGLRPFESYMIGREERAFLPTWEDASYYYRLNLAPAVAQQSILDAVPQKRSITGRVAFRCPPNGAVSEVPLTEPTKETAPLTVDEREQAARKVAGDLAQAVRKAELLAALQRFATLAAEVAEPEIPASAPESGFGRSGVTAYPTWGSADYCYRMWIIATPESCDLELLAWPRVPGSTGWAAFRHTRSLGMQQSRNMVRRYAGSKNGPPPGAGFIRPGSRPDGNGGYTGSDGNRWFPVS